MKVLIISLFQMVFVKMKWCQKLLVDDDMVLKIDEGN